MTKQRAEPKRIVSIADLQPDPANANRHTERGLGMLDHSLRQYGAGRSILADRQGRVIAGSATLERAAELGLEIEVVRTRGDKLVVVQREDLDLDDPESADARELAIADNRIAEVDLDWDGPALIALQERETDLTAFFLDEELADITASGTSQERVAFEAKRKKCTCCKKKCRKGCGCYGEN